MSFFLHLRCGLNLRRQDSWGAYIPKWLLEKAAVTEKRGAVGTRGYVMPGGELLAFWARFHLSQGECRVTVLSLMALSLFLFLSWGLNVLFLLSLVFFNSGKRDRFPAMLWSMFLVLCSRKERKDETLRWFLWNASYTLKTAPVGGRALGCVR